MMSFLALFLLWGRNDLVRPIVIGLCFVAGFWLSVLTSSLYGGALVDANGVETRLLALESNGFFYSVLGILYGACLIFARRLPQSGCAGETLSMSCRDVRSAQGVGAGDPADDVVLMVHGYPDTWWANAEVMALLSDDFYVIAVDVLGYGQSDKGPGIDVSYAGAAASLSNLLDKIGVTDFNLISHDRGTIVSENLLAIEGLSDRVLAYVRMQQSFDQPHGLPRPPHAAMASVEFQSQENLARTAYTSDYGSVHFPERFLKRLDWEFSFPGTPEAAARTFQGTSFDIELAFRMEKVIPKMTMPVLLIQGTDDPGQKAEEYMTSSDLLPDARVALVAANHFLHAEDPHMVADLARELFVNGNANRPEDVFVHPVSFQYPAKN